MSQAPTIKMILRDETEFTSERSLDEKKMFRNYDPKLHPFQKAREYTRALNAAKLDKHFSKPFVHSFDHHYDSIHAITRVPGQLPLILSGDAQGYLNLYHLGSRKCQWTAQGHKGKLAGITTDPFGEFAFSCGVDNTVKMWKINTGSYMNYDDEDLNELNAVTNAPINVFLGQHYFNAIHHHNKNPQFATGSDTVDIWDQSRNEPIHSFQWGASTITTLRFNPIDTDIIASSGSDRSIVLYDVRSKLPLKKILMRHFTNAISWNPMQSMNFVVGNEDTNAYSFDMRKLEAPTQIHVGSVAPITSIDYSPTGQEFVTGSYDKCIRIYNPDKPVHRECYFAKRMQRVWSVSYTADSKYILSGSEDTNLRLWKSISNERIAPLAKAAQTNRDYEKKLVEKYQDVGDVKRVSRDKKLPRYIKGQLHKKKIMDDAALRRQKKDSRNQDVKIYRSLNKKAKETVVAIEK